MMLQGLGHPQSKDLPRGIIRRGGFTCTSTTVGAQESAAIIGGITGGVPETLTGVRSFYLMTPKHHTDIMAARPSMIHTPMQHQHPQETPHMIIAMTAIALKMPMQTSWF